MALEPAYVAGLLDGEGCISATHHRNKQGKLYSYVTVGISNVHKGVLEEIQAEHGGHICGGKPRGLGKLPVWTWHATNRTAKEFLTVVRPFMRIKTKQADLALQFYATYQRRKYNALNPTEWEARELIVAGIKNANRNPRTWAA